MIDPQPGARLGVSASIVSAQLLDLREELERLRSAGVDGVHVDIEDGRFVPVMGLGTRIIDAVAEWGGLPVDVHLMVTDPELALRMLDGARISAIAVHAESTRYPRRMLRLVRESGRLAGLALNPATPLPELESVIPYLDYLLMLTTEPEHADPLFLRWRLDAVARAAEACRRWGVPVIVDGGVGIDQVAAIADAGAAGVVVGRGLFAAGPPSGRDLAATVRALREAVA